MLNWYFEDFKAFIFLCWMTEFAEMAYIKTLLYSGLLT